MVEARTTGAIVMSVVIALSGCSRGDDAAADDAASPDSTTAPSSGSTTATTSGGADTTDTSQSTPDSALDSAPRGSGPTDRTATSVASDTTPRSSSTTIVSSPSPTTSAAPAATTTTAAPAPTSTTATRPIGGTPPDTAFAIVESDLVEIDSSSGATRRTVVERFEGEGVFRSDLELAPDRTTAYFGEGYEDFWFSCESSVGAIGRVDLGSGALETIGAGWSPSLSPDATRLAFVTSNVCVPDPQFPDSWVLTPGDRVIVVDLATSARVEIRSAAPPADYSDPNALNWVAFHPSGDLLVGVAADDVHRVGSTTPGVVQDGPVVSSGATGFPVAVYETALVTLLVGDEGATTMAAVDLTTGGITPIHESEIFVAADGDPKGNLIVIDATAASSTTSGDLTVVALDAFVTDVAW